MRFPDVEVMVRQFLLARLSVPVATKVPSSRPASFVRVWRSGGAAINRVLDQPVMTVQAWASDDGEAAELARVCREALLSDYTSMPLVRGVEEVGGPYFDPDPDTGIDRYTFNMSLQVRARR